MIYGKDLYYEIIAHSNVVAVFRFNLSNVHPKIKQCRLLIFRIITAT